MQQAVTDLGDPETPGPGPQDDDGDDEESDDEQSLLLLKKLRKTARWKFLAQHS